MTLPFSPVKLYVGLAAVASKLQSPLLLLIRLYWGWGFFVTGKGKLEALDKTAEFFGGLGIPFPKLNAAMAGSMECIGGILLMLGLGSRLISIPLAIVLGVAYATADREALLGIFQEPDKFFDASPFLFLFAVLIILAFGPGVFSLDWLIGRKFRNSGNNEPSI